MSWKTIKLAAVLFALWIVASAFTGAYVLDSACSAETRPESSGGREPTMPPGGPPSQLEGQHSEQGEQPAVDSLKAVEATVLGGIAYLATAPLRMDAESGLIVAG